MQLQINCLIVIMQLTYFLCKKMNNTQQLNDNEWQVRGLNSSTSSWTIQMGANM
jgi:hypothetical protein